MPSKRKKSRGYNTKSLGLDYGVVNKFIDDMYIAIRRKDISELFQIKFDGCVFNGLEFLIMGSEWWNKRVRYGFGHTATETLSDLHAVDLSEKPEGTSEEVFLTLTPLLFGTGNYELARYVARVRPYDFAYLLAQASVNMLQDVLIDGEFRYLEYKCPGISNTQAFCAYITIAWAITIYPPLGVYLTRQIKQVGYSNLMKQFFKEGSAHYRYIHNEITADELFKLYNKDKLPDGSTLHEREVLSSLTEGVYDGSDFTPADRALVDNFIDQLDQSSQRFSAQLGSWYASSYARVTNDEKMQKLESKIEHLTHELEVQRNKTLSVQRKKEALSKELNEKRGEVKDLRHKLASVTVTPDTKRETQLLQEVKDLQASLDSILDKYSFVKTELRALKKKTRFIGNIDMTEVEEEVIPEVEALSEDDMISELHDLKILVVGGQHLGFTDYFNKLGMNATQFHERLRQNYRCDVIFVITDFTSHKDVAAAVAWVKNASCELLYFDGTNKSNSIKRLYELVADPKG